MTRVVNIKYEPYDIYIGRAGKGQDGYFGNNHIIGKCNIMTCNCVHNRDEAIAAYKKDFDYRIQFDGQFYLRVLELKDKVLGCFCKNAPWMNGVSLACHGDVIADYLNNLNKNI